MRLISMFFTLCATETWSSPQVNGDKPPACAWFACTKISELEMIQCGGLKSEKMIYKLDLATMVSLHDLPTHVCSIVNAII